MNKKESVQSGNVVMSGFSEVDRKLDDALQAVWATELEEFHHRILYPTVLVRTKSAGGSGTTLYSKPHPDGEGALTYILTNHHVIDDAITFTEDYDPIVGRDVKKPVREVVSVGFYSYRHLSKQASVVGYQADIVHWDKGRDLALLELRERRGAEYVAALFPEKDKHLYIGQPVIAVGCSLGHKPLPSIGIISSLDEQIDNQPRLLSSAQTIFGNSGGALYTLEDKELIGVPCAGDVIIMGFSAQAITHLGYSIPYFMLYDFLRDGCYEFIYDPSCTYEECEARRQEKMDDLQRAWEARFKREKALGK